MPTTTNITNPTLKPSSSFSSFHPSSNNNNNNPSTSSSSNNNNPSNNPSNNNNNNNNPTNNNNEEISHVKEEILIRPFTNEQQDQYQKQFKEILNKLKQTQTDGKEKAKALEMIIHFICFMKSDFTITCLLPSTNSPTSPPSNNNNNSKDYNNNLQNNNLQQNNYLLDLFIKIIRSLLLHRSSYLRSLTVRMLRYLIQFDSEHFPIEILWNKYHLHLFIFKLMLNDTDREKIQGIEFIRCLCIHFNKRKKYLLKLNKNDKNDKNDNKNDNKNKYSNTNNFLIPYLFIKGIVHFLNYIDGTLQQMEQAQLQSQSSQQGLQQQQQVLSKMDLKKQYFLETYKNVCIEILRDGLCEDDFELNEMIIQAGGLKYLIDLLLDVKYSNYHISILNTILYIYDKNKNKNILIDLNSIISPFINYVQNNLQNNNNSINGNLQNELERSKFILLFLMRSWTGLFIIYQTTILKTFSDLLKLPNREYLKHLILDIYIEILKQNVPTKYHHLIPPIYNECEIYFKTNKSMSLNNRNNGGNVGGNNGGNNHMTGYSATNTNGGNVGGNNNNNIGPTITTTNNGNVTTNVGGNNVTGNVTVNTNTGNNTNSNVGSVGGTSGGGGANVVTSVDRLNNPLYHSFTKDVNFYADHSADTNRMVNLCFIFLSMTLLTLIDSEIIDTLLYLSKQSINNDKNFISFRASQLLQSLLLFSDMLLSKPSCLKMQDKFDMEINNFLIKKQNEHFVSYKTLSMLSAFYQQSFTTTISTTSGNNSNAATTTTTTGDGSGRHHHHSGNNALSFTHSNDNDNNGGGVSTPTNNSNNNEDKFSKFSTNNIPTFYIRTQIDSDMDDITFHQLIKESNVLVTKDYRKWNWEKIYGLIFGPLRVAHRLKEVLMKNSKLLKRILSYFKPYKKAFSELKYQESNFGYTKLIKELLLNLLHMDESGIEMIRSSKLLSQLYEMLDLERQVYNKSKNSNHQLSITSSNNQFNNNNNSSGNNKLSILKLNSRKERMLSEDKIQKYMVRDYFTIIGLMSSTLKGKKLLEEEHVFEVLKDLTTCRDDICQLIIKHLDYVNNNNNFNNPIYSNYINLNNTNESPARNILKEAMMNGSNIIRYISTLFIRNLIRNQQQLLNNNLIIDWIIPILTKKLYDDWEKVRFSAISILNEICNNNQNNSLNSNEYLKCFVKQSISKEIIQIVMRESKDGMNLLLKVLSCKEGINYLNEINLLNDLLKEWNEKESTIYLQQIEYALNRFYQMNATIILKRHNSTIINNNPYAINGNNTINTSGGVNHVGSFTATTPTSSGSGGGYGGGSGSGSGGNNKFNDSSIYDYAKHGVIITSNLYGELCTTLEGCTILSNNLILNNLLNNLLYVYNNLDKIQQSQIVNLWSLAYCCSTNIGYEYCNRYLLTMRLPFTSKIVKDYNNFNTSNNNNNNTNNNEEEEEEEEEEKMNIVQYFIYIAMNARELSLRGSILYLLGILSKCSLARKDLLENNFECSYRYGIAIPKNRILFFSTSLKNNTLQNTLQQNSLQNNLNNSSDNIIFVIGSNVNDQIVLNSILKDCKYNDLIMDLVTNVVNIANPVLEQDSYLNLQNLKLKITKYLNNIEKSKLIIYFLKYHFTFYKYKWKVIKFILNDLLGGNTSMLNVSLATTTLQNSGNVSNNVVIDDCDYVMNQHLVWLDETCV
ncbi:hypothetical protein ABK040_012083 [Willaertia magna]